MGMKFTGCHLAGLYPRSDQLITLMRKHGRGTAGREELLSAVCEESRKIVETQRKAGMTIIVEGQLMWHDHFRPFTESIHGMEPGPLTRWFDNNMFYKKPVIIDELVWNRPVLLDYIILDAVRNTRWKLVLPEPYTFAALSDDRYYGRVEELVIAIADILSKELSILEERTSIEMVQLSAPMIVQRRLDRDSAEIVRQGIKQIKKTFSGRLMIHTFFGDFSHALPWILDLGADLLGIDLTSTGIENLAQHDIDRPLYAGILDSRNSYVESVEEVVRTAEALLEKVEPPEIHIGTSADMDFLPKTVADRKVTILGAAYKALRGE